VKNRITQRAGVVALHLNRKNFVAIWSELLSCVPPVIRSVEFYSHREVFPPSPLNLSDLLHHLFHSPPTLYPELHGPGRDGATAKTQFLAVFKGVLGGLRGGYGAGYERCGGAKDEGGEIKN
jgi:hypothetical protein